MYEQCKLTDIPNWLKKDEAYHINPERVTAIIEQNMRKTEDKVRKSYAHTNAIEENLQRLIKEALYDEYFGPQMPYFFFLFTGGIMDRLTTWMMAMVTIGGMALGAAATLGVLRIGGKIRVKVEQVE